MKYYTFFIVWLSVVSIHTHGQSKDTNRQVPTSIATASDTGKAKLVTRPTIMVFPMFKENESIREVVENDINARIVMTKVKEIFDKRGYSTVDFLSKARNMAINEILTSENQTDLKTQIISGSGTDICVEVEYIFNTSGSGNEVSVTLNAYESSTSMTLANKVGSSGKFYTQDIARLINRSVELISEDFLNIMQQKFNDIVENGRYLSLEFNLADGTDINMETEIGSDTLPLSDIIEEWVSTHTKSYHIQGTTNLKTIFDVIRVPRNTPDNRPLTTTRYSLDIMKFCNQLSLSKKPERKIRSERLVKGNTILITLK